MGRQNEMRLLAVDDELAVDVDAARWWNAARIGVAARERYHLMATGAWCDARIRTGPAGYSSPWLALFGGMRRVGDANWFSLIAAVHASADLDSKKPAAENFLTGWIESRKLRLHCDDRDADLANIGAEGVFDVKKKGYLYLFANDASFAYCNNSGSVRVQIRRLA